MGTLSWLLLGGQLGQRQQVKAARFSAARDGYEGQWGCHEVLNSIPK